MLVQTAKRSKFKTPHGQLPLHAVRGLSREAKQFWKDVWIRSLKVTGYGFILIGCFIAEVFVVQKEVLRQKYDTPEDWSWKASQCYKGAYVEENQGRRIGIVNWAGVGKHFQSALRLLEDPEKDGKGVSLLSGDTSEQEAGQEPAFDISGKSPEWIQAYHTCLMGVGKAAENCETMMIDESQNLLIPRDIVVGPSNPRPKPMQPGKFKTPLEENCVECFKSADNYYKKALRTKGFNARQRMDAALSLADWYDYKGFPDKAKEMYELSLVIAQSSLPTEAQSAVSVKTGVISDKADYVSSNVLNACTALAQYQARHNHLSEALPIFLSILRARRHLLEPYKERRTYEPVIGTWDETWYWAKRVLFPIVDPPLLSDGNERPTRTPTAVCEEAGIMTNIGEILLASSSSRDTLNQDETNRTSLRETPSKTASFIKNAKGFDSGLAWTRDAVSLAENTLKSLPFQDSNLNARNKCIQCMSAGMENWQSMVNKRLAEVRTAEYTTKKSSVGNLFWGHNHTEDFDRWEDEAKAVETKSKAVRRQVFNEDNRPLPWWIRTITRERRSGM